MFEALFGNGTKEKILYFLVIYEEGYAQEIADTFAISLNMVQKQLARLEEGSVLVSQLKGRTRIYLWNPRYPFLKELRRLLDRGLEFISEKDKENYFRKRKRPRKRGKPV